MRILILFFSLVPTLLSAQVNNRIDSIEFRGFKRCKTQYLSRFIESKKGEILDYNKIKMDQDHLNSLGYFSSLGIFTVRKGDSTILVIQGKEVITTLPFLNWSGTRENLKVNTGFSEFNLSGRGIQLYLNYEYYQRHSFFGSLMVPYFGKTNFGTRIISNRHATLEPAGPLDKRLYYNVDRFQLSTDLSYEFDYGHKVYIGVGTFFESILLAPTGNEALEDFYINEQELTQKFLYKFEHHIFDKKYIKMSIDGFSNQFRSELVQSPGMPYFIKFTNNFNYYYFNSKKTTIAIRQYLGITSNRTNPFPAFVLDNYINIRGVGDRSYRGSAEVSLNLEYRHNFFQNQTIGIQGVGFYDSGMLRSQNDEWKTLTDNWIHFVGLGGRVHLFKFYQMILRGDIGLNMANFKHYGFVIGVGQYF